MSAVRDDRGAVLVMFAVWLPVLLAFVVFVADVGNWFVHKRHLQMQADAGALAGGGLFTVPCNDASIIATARKYGGDPNAVAPYNLQVPPTDPANVHVLVNSTSYWNQGGNDYTDGGPPCAAKMVDLKLTEADLPLFFGVIPSLSVVPAINARARVSIQQLSYASGGLPIAVPDVDPTKAQAKFIDETTGAVLATTDLTNSGVANGLAIWDNSGAPVSVPVNTSRIGLRITLSGTTSTNCLDPLVDCYDLGDNGSYDLDDDGVVHVRGWSSSPSGAQPNPPRARDARLFPGTCSDPYFSSDTSTCSIGVSAVVDFGPDPDGSDVGARVSATVDGSTNPLTYDAATGRWESTGNNFFSIDPGVGPVPVELKWEEWGVGTVGGQACGNGNNACKGSFGIVQRSFSANETRSGPIKVAQVWENGSFWANSFQIGTTHNLVVKIGLVPNLQNARDVNDPIVTLRVAGGSQNQSLDCDPDWSNLADELANGCRPHYTPNSGTPCPAWSALWGSPEPWECVKIQTGGAVNQVPKGLNLRILGDEKPSTCTSPNNWSMFPNIPPGDPRVLNVFMTPFGSFSGSGNKVVPVTKLGTFYITGWTGQGQGFNNPCQGNGDDPVPNNDPGNIVGHFIKYIFSLNDGGGSGEVCDFNAFGSCTAVLTE